VVAAASTMQDAGLTLVEGGGLSDMLRLGHPPEN